MVCPSVRQFNSASLHFGYVYEKGTLKIFDLRFCTKLNFSLPTISLSFAIYQNHIKINFQRSNSMWEVI